MAERKWALGTLAVAFATTISQPVVDYNSLWCGMRDVGFKSRSHDTITPLAATTTNTRSRGSRPTTAHQRETWLRCVGDGHDGAQRSRGHGGQQVRGVCISAAPRDALGGSDAETLKKALAGAGAASSSSDGGPAGAGAAALGASPVGVGAGAGPTAAMERQAPGTSEGARVAAPASDPTAPSAPGVALSGAAADPAAVGTGSEASSGPFSADNPQRKYSTTTAFTTTSRRHPNLLPLAPAVSGLGGWRLGGQQGGSRQLHVSAARGAEGEAGPYSVPPMTPGAPGCGVTGPAAAGAARTEAGPASGYGGASGAGGTPGASEERGEAQGGSQPTAAKSATPAEGGREQSSGQEAH